MNFKASPLRIALLAALALPPLGIHAQLPPAQESPAQDSISAVSSAPAGTVSSFVNAQLPPWLWLRGEERVRIESLRGKGFTTVRDAYPLQRLRLQLGVRVRPWLKFSFEGQDSRVFSHHISPAPASLRNPMDLRQGYMEVGDAETGRFRVRAGRQALEFGDGMLVEDPGWSNTGLTFDAVRLTLHSGRFRVDAFTGAPDEINPEGFDKPARGERLHGLYGSIEKLIPNATLEPYLFLRRMDLRFGEGAETGQLDSRTAGFRWAGMLPQGFDYGMEMALQRGSQARQRVSAWASSWTFGYSPIHVRHHPRLFVELSRFSGDGNPRDGVHGGFDSLYSGAEDAYDTTSLFGDTNLVHARPGVELELREGLTLTFAGHAYWRASLSDGLYNGPGQLVVAAEDSRGRRIGQGADVRATWRLRRDTSLDFNVGRLLPGEFLRHGGRESAYNYLYLGMSERF